MFLFIGLLTAGAVGGTAYWLLMRDFRHTVLERAFQHFQADVAAYISTYGSWAQAVRAEPFPQFVHRNHQPTPGSGGQPPSDARARLRRDGLPPFMFMLLDTDGRIIKPARGYALDQRAPADIVAQARPIKVHGNVVALAVPLGDPNLSASDRAYLLAMRNALISGVGAAGVLALLMGFFMGRRISTPLGELTAALRSMDSRGEIHQQVPVRSRDEIGQLAQAFNRMNTELTQAHDALRERAVTVKAQAAELLESSIRDPLTGLYNRRHFDEQARTLYQQAVRHARPLSVVVADLDHFKNINDAYSHAVGDEVLRAVGQLLTEYTRKSDLVARYGGEEFVIVCPESTLEQTLQRCEGLRQQIERYPWASVHPELRVTLSIGVSAAVELGEIRKMFDEADARLYAAKRAGRNRVEPAIHMEEDVITQRL